MDLNSHQAIRPLTTAEICEHHFHFMLRGDEVRLYLNNQPIASRPINPGEDPQEIANQWKEELYDCS